MHDNCKRTCEFSQFYFGTYFNNSDRLIFALGAVCIPNDFGNLSINIFTTSNLLLIPFVECKDHRSESTYLIFKLGVVKKFKSGAKLGRIMASAGERKNVVTRKVLFYGF